MRSALLTFVAFSLAVGWCGHSLAKEGASAEKDAVTDETKPFPYPLALEAPKPETITPPQQAAIKSSIDRGVVFLLE